ncbi:pumilio-family RNA binding repeat domain-containing protein [Hirsutella rhossiliensis]|uniref:Pumilio homology domain family member 3 n=1 Tax=Hirsutella rhossiliensis TaxID=111463 RepID=A0A9P8N501_9HYPO|nr:pumilio-family RNA binding repeat domain-containing protein [Hirsutella rhossiliensis]KAH0965894.1 pumilio-family RNA binding repeat domain-containing protein [Hirsutella rhossiliensis]
MPTGSNDKSQQPMGSGFPGSNLYPNKNIWTSSLSSARERSIGSKESDDSPSGSSALNANSEADVWSSNPWNTEHPGRSVSTSPSRTRDGALSNASGYFDPQSSAIGMKKANYGGKPFGDESSAYGSAFASQKRGAQDTAAYMESMAGYSHHRDGSLPPSRHSQSSPAYQDLYRAGHTPSNSIQSQRQMANHASSYSTQSANQRAFNLNKQIDEDISLQFGRRMALDSPSSATSYNPPSQPFQFNPGSQPWVGEGNGMRYGVGMDSPVDPLAAQYAVLKRSPVERLSPGSSYRLESGNSPQGYTPTSNTWPSRSASRDPRPSDYERRAPAQGYAPNYTPSFFPNQFPYANLPPQYAASFLDPYNQNFRHHPMMAGYGLHTMQAGYPMGANLPPARPSRDQDSGKGMRSALLDEFRLSNKSSKRYELKDIYSYMVEFSGDQHGSRFIQQKLETANSDEKEQVFREIEPNAIQLMKDVFGNYVVQKFFEHGNQVQKKVLAEKMKGKVVDLSVQVYACRVVQKALEHVLVEQQAELTKELEPEILRVTRDQNGNHVVQKIIELVPRRYIDFIMNALRGQVTGLASHTYGCRVIQRMLEHGTDADKVDIMTELHGSAQILITDQYGNYVAQHVIQNGNQQDRQRMIELVMSQLLTLSKHKFASNVVEKCIEYGTAEQRTAIRTHLTTVGSDGTNPLQQMMRDQYGNYVIQKLLGQLDGAEKEALVEDIKPQFFALKKNGASRQLQALEKFFEPQAGAVSIKTETLSHADAGSAAGTPLLTNDPNSPESSSPPSTHLSADSFPVNDADKHSSRQAPKVQGDVARN